MEDRDTGMLPAVMQARPRRGTSRRPGLAGTLTLDGLAETEIGDWKMPNLRQGWLFVVDDTLPLIAAGLATA